MASLKQWIERADVGSLRRALAAAVFLFLWSLTTHEKYSGSGDEPHYMMIAHSLVFDRDLDLSNNYGDKNNIIYDGNLGLEEAHALSGKDGKLYSFHDIGMPVLFSPYFAVAYLVSERAGRMAHGMFLQKVKLNRWGLLRLFLSLAMIFLTCILSIHIFDLSLYFCGDKYKSFLWTLLSVLSPPILSFSFLFYTELLIALIGVYVYKKLTMEKVLSIGQYSFLGFLLGLLFFIHVRSVGLIAVLGFFLARRMAKDMKWGNTILFLASGCALVGIFKSMLTFHLWGYFLIPNAGSRDMSSVLTLIRDVVRGFLGLWFDQEAGLLLYAPIYILFPAGFFLLFFKNRKLFIELSSLFFVNYFLIVSFPLWNRHDWHGFWAPASRYLIIVIPFLSLGTLFLFTEVDRLPFIVKAIVILQVFLNLFFWQFPKLLWNDGDGVSVFLRFMGGGSNLIVNLFPSLLHFSSYSFLISLIFLSLWIVLSISIMKRTNIRFDIRRVQ